MFLEEGAIANLNETNWVSRAPKRYVHILHQGRVLCSWLHPAAGGKCFGERQSHQRSIFLFTLSSVVSSLRGTLAPSKMVNMTAISLAYG